MASIIGETIGTLLPPVFVEVAVMVLVPVEVTEPDAALTLIACEAFATLMLCEALETLILLEPDEETCVSEGELVLNP